MTLIQECTSEHVNILSNLRPYVWRFGFSKSRVMPRNVILRNSHQVIQICTCTLRTTAVEPPRSTIPLEYEKVNEHLSNSTLETLQTEQRAWYPKTAKHYLTIEHSMKVPSHLFFLHDELIFLNYENLCLLILLFPIQNLKVSNGVFSISSHGLCVHIHLQK